jgi:hypothetical protein
MGIKWTKWTMDIMDILHSTSDQVTVKPFQILFREGIQVFLPKKCFLATKDFLSVTRKNLFVEKLFFGSFR